MALFGGSPKHPKLDQLSQIIQNSLGLQLSPPDEGVLSIIETMTPHDFIGVQNSRSVEGAQEIFRTKSLRAVIDNASRTIALSMAAPEEIDRELKAAHSAVNVFHVGEHHGTARIIRAFNPTTEPVAATTAGAAPGAQTETAAPPVPPAFEHLEAAERLCPVVIDLFVKHGQLTTADKEVLKKIKAVDYTLEARIGALERWKAEVVRRARGVHVQQGGATTLLGSGGDGKQNSEEAVLRRFDTFLHWLAKLIKALENKGIKFHGRPVWLH
jgi:hypothetical protein